MKVVILESLNINDQRLNQLEAPFKEKGVEFASYERTDDRNRIIAEADGADAVILANMPLPEAVIDQMDHVRFIDVAFTGVDHIGLNACRRKQIAVSNASGYSTEAVSELAVGTVISMYRSLRENEERLRSEKGKLPVPGLQLQGKTVGIIGLGSIGMRSAELFHAFGCSIVASKKHPASVPAWIELTDNDTVLKKADIVLLHCPLNNETRGMINHEKLSLMKSTAILVNMARGPIVNTDDLIKALNAHMIAGAVSDVFDQEPPLKNSAALPVENTLFTPHIGFFTKEAMELRGQIVFENLAAWMNGRQKNAILP